MKEVKTAIREYLKDRYAEAAFRNFLHKGTALDSRFEAFAHGDNAYNERIYNNITTVIVDIVEQVLNLFYIMLLFMLLLCVSV